MDSILGIARPPGPALPRFALPPKLTISVTETCPLACSHCYADCNRSDAPPELRLEEWTEFIDELAAGGVIQVYFEGGEPFARPDFTSLLEHCCPLMMTLVRTHGTLIDPPLANRLRRIGVGRMFVDLLGANPATHDAATGVPGSFAAATAGARALVAAGIPTDLLVILTRHTAPELQAMLELAHGLGCERVGILRLYPLGRAKRRWAELALSLDEQMAAIAALRPPEGLGVMQSWHPRDRNCCWQAAAVTAHGRSIGCMYLREYVDHGDVRQVPFFESWARNDLYRQLRAGRVDRSCPDCTAAAGGAGGGCRSTAFAFHGSWTAPDPFCAHLNDGVDLRVLPERLLRQGR
jgi:MoaA/NifB/PqqE/SkfB family radical SAM enzyme